MSGEMIVFISVAYLLLLFLIAWFGDKSEETSIYSNRSSWIYALSLTVYCTAWTFYGSVGKATVFGLDFLAIYIGPTLGAIFFYPILTKIIKICKAQNLTSLADMLSARYGRSFSVAALVTVLCVVGIIPYISLQLKAIAESVSVLAGLEEDFHLKSFAGNVSPDFLFSGLILLFVWLFGTRSLYPDEKHSGLIRAVAFEAVIKLIAFLAIGSYVVYILFDGFGDIFEKAKEAGYSHLFSLSGSSYSSWIGLLTISFLAIFLLPRQFQVAVVENQSEDHVRSALWRFPLYLLLINVFVFPIALAGLILIPNLNTGADTYILALPLSTGADFLGILTYLGGFSAATSMVILETIALSTMLSNNIVTPLVLWFRRNQTISLQKSILNIRRFSMLLIIVFAYVYERNIAKDLSLVSIGLISFVAVAQLAPAMFFGLYWRSGTKNGAMTGIVVGFVFWMYMLVLPTLIPSGLVSETILSGFGIDFLKPYAFLGMTGLDPIVHAAFWSLSFNIFAYILVSLFTKQTALELYQSDFFVNILNRSNEKNTWKGETTLPDLNSLLASFIPMNRAENLINSYAVRHKLELNEKSANPKIVSFVENLLSGIIASRFGPIMVQSVTREEDLEIGEVLDILKESQQLMALNKELVKKSQQLETATAQLQAANEQLQEMDMVKDEFLYTVTHELRTPITSIRMMAEILYDHQDVSHEDRQRFLNAMVKEIERLSHLITRVLDLERYSTGKQRLEFKPTEIVELINDCIQSLSPLIREKGITIATAISNTDYILNCDANHLKQVFINLLSNAIKFVPNNDGFIRIAIIPSDYNIEFWIEDNGPGIPEEDWQLVFDKFYQAKNQTLKKPEGSGLGLAICAKIIELHDGHIQVNKSDLGGARFIFNLPM